MKNKTQFTIIMLSFFILMNLYSCQLPSKETVTQTESPGNPIPEPSASEPEIEKPLLNTTGKWEITFADHEVFSTKTKFRYEFAKVEDGIVRLIEKRSWDKTETTLHEYHNQSSSDFLLTLSLSPNGQFFAYDSTEGLVVYDRTTSTQRILENIVVNKDVSSKNKSYIGHICWSPDNQYLLLQYVAYEATTVYLYDLKQDKKLSLSGNGLLCGAQMLWAPDKNVFLDPSSDHAYGDPGLYQSDQNNLKKYSDISASFGMQNQSFYKAVYHPDGKQIAIITNGEPIENQIDIFTDRKISLVNLQTNKVTEIGQGNLLDSLFFSPDGNVLYYFCRDEGDSPITWFLSYDVRIQHSSVEGYFAADKINFRDMQWIDAQSALLEVVQWNEDLSFRHTQIIGLDFTQKKQLYCTQPYPVEIKLLSADQNE